MKRIFPPLLLGGCVIGTGWKIFSSGLEWRILVAVLLWPRIYVYVRKLKTRLMDEVYGLGSGTLLVRNEGREERIPIAEIDGVFYSRNWGVTLLLIRETAFGDSILFMPAFSWKS